MGKLIQTSARWAPGGSNEAFHYLEMPFHPHSTRQNQGITTIKGCSMYKLRPTCKCWWQAHADGVGVACRGECPCPSQGDFFSLSMHSHRSMKTSRLSRSNNNTIDGSSSVPAERLIFSSEGALYSDDSLGLTHHALFGFWTFMPIFIDFLFDWQWLKHIVID